MGLVSPSREGRTATRGLTTRSTTVHMLLPAVPLLALGACDGTPSTTENDPNDSDLPGAVAGLAFDVEQVTLEPGEDLDLQVFFTDAGDEPLEAASPSNVAWSSSNPEVATVDAGTVTAHQPGEARVTAEHSAGHRAGADVHVAETASPPPDDALFYEDWGSGDFRQWDDGPSRPRTWNVIRAPHLAHTGDHVLEVEIPANQDGGYIGAFRALSPGAREVYVRARVRLADGFDGFLRFFNVRAADPNHRDWPWHALGGAGQCPQGDDRVRIGFIGWDEDASSEPTLRWYNYWRGMWPEPDGSTCWGRFSPDRNNRNATYVSGPGRLPVGEWFTLELHAKLNKAGRADGSARMWLDGELRAHWKGEEWRTTDRLLFNIFQMDLRGRAPVVRHVYFDDILVLDAPPAGRR